MRFYKFFFLVLSLLCYVKTKGQDTTNNYIVNNFVYGIGLYHTYSSANTTAGIKYDKARTYAIANEITPKTGISLHATRLKLKPRKWTTSPEARFHYYRDYISINTLTSYPSLNGGYWENISVSLQDIYIGFGQNLYRPISKSLAFESGIFFDYLLIGTRGKRVKFDAEYDPKIDNFNPSELTYDFNETLYFFSRFKASAKIGLLKIITVPRITKKMLFRFNIEQTFFQTPVSLKLRQTFFNANIGFIF